MKKRVLFITIFFMFLLMSLEVHAYYEFFDGKLRVKGRLEQFMVFLTNVPREESFYRNKRRLAVNQSIFTFEGLYTFIDNGEWLVNFQSFLRYYYESAPDMDHRLQRSYSSSRRRYKKYQTNRYDSDDWINELYADIHKGPWNFRLGKQIVVWSEVEMIQTIDKINPLDLRYATPGMQPFDELKLGLWMIRSFYNSELPGNLIFENIFIPGDYERTRSPFEGTWLSSGPAPGEIKNQPGQGDAIYWMWDQATPRLSIENYQYAFRVRGNSEAWMFNTPYIVDWTLSYWNGIDTGHAVFTDTETVNAVLSANAPGRALRGESADIPYGRSVAEWKRYQAVGASFQTYVPPLGAVLRGELSYVIGRKWNAIDSETAVRRVGNLGLFEDRIIKRDYLSYGITVDKPICFPFYGERMAKWGVRPCWDLTFGLFGGYWKGNVSRIWQWSSGYKNRSNTFLTMMIRGGFRHNEFIPVLRMKYSTRNFGFIVPVLMYMPGRHLRVEAGYMYLYGKSPEDHRDASIENRDQAWMRVRWEY